MELIAIENQTKRTHALQPNAHTRIYAFLCVATYASRVYHICDNKLILEHFLCARATKTRATFAPSAAPISSAHTHVSVCLFPFRNIYYTYGRVCVCGGLIVNISKITDDSNFTKQRSRSHKYISHAHTHASELHAARSSLRSRRKGIEKSDAFKYCYGHQHVFARVWRIHAHCTSTTHMRTMLRTYIKCVQLFRAVWFGVWFAQ